MLAEMPGRLHPAAFQFLGEQRHECRVEGTFGKQPAEEIRETEGGIKGVGYRPHAKGCGNQRLTYETQHAAGHGGASHAGELSDKAHARRPLPMAVDGEEVECFVGITDGCLALAQCREKGIRISRTELSNNNNLDPFRVSGKFGKDLATFFPAAITRPPPSRASGCRA